jgi:hypothetical protein
VQFPIIKYRKTLIRHSLSRFKVKTAFQQFSLSACQPAGSAFSDFLGESKTKNPRSTAVLTAMSGWTTELPDLNR